MPIRTSTEGVGRTLKNICTFNARIDLRNVPDHLMNMSTSQNASTSVENFTRCIPDRSKVIFNDFVKERVGKIPAKHFLGTSNEMQGVDV